MSDRISRQERGAFFIFGGMVFFLTIVATPSIMIVTLFDYIFNKRGKR
jgi:hypothetical protein